MNVVFILNEYSLHNHVVTSYLEARPDDRVALVKVPLVLKGRGRVDTARRIVPRLSRRFLIGKLMEFPVVLAITLIPKLLRRGAIFRRLRRIAATHALPFHRSSDVMSEETLGFVREQRPDVVVTLMHQIVKAPLIEIPRAGVVNVHPGLLPDFRGIQPYFWALAEGASEAGASLHLIEDEGIDTGGLLARASFPVRRGMSVQLAYYLASRCAARLLPDVLERVGARELSPVPQDLDAGAYFRWPDSAAFDRLKDRGHPLVSWRDLRDVLVGRHDGFEPGSVEMLAKPV